jgi:hypothetical protein
MDAGMSTLKFASTTEALQYLADKTGRRVVVAGKTVSNDEFRKTLDEVNWDGSKLESGIEVRGDLDLSAYIRLKELPTELKAGGDLDLAYCRNLVELPAGLEVGRDLNLFSCTSLKELTAGLKVGGYLNLSGCTSLEYVPDDIQVGSVIYCDKKQKLELFVKARHPLTKKVITI